MQELAARLAGGETAAFAELYDACANQLHHYLVVRLRSRDAADDVLQETFLRLARLRHAFKSVENPVAYAFTVARNEANRRQQRAGREGFSLTMEDLFQVAGQDDREQRENTEAVTKALRNLTEEQREVIELKFYGGLTLREIGEVTGVPQGTVATRYRAAIGLLRNSLAKEWS
ncbi:MAG TPA: sigma-70 family RNA polymerase sigma factor [Pirellulales bacterium]|nr:sigma-70 family RNA polymerase sigma factor [Pirellulales bacterium]